MSVQEGSTRVGDALQGQLPVYKDNPCPFLRALVAGGYVDGNILPLTTTSRTTEAVSANRERDGARARWYFRFLMKGEWPVLLDVMGKGDGSSRYLSVAEVSTLFIERRVPERIVARLMAKPAPTSMPRRIGKVAVGVVGT